MAIIIKNLEFYNMYNYAKNNKLFLNEFPIVQLTAPNGWGKTTIALIIQELLYSKNIKGIKKGDIKNRNIKENEWGGSITFTDSVSQNEYIVTNHRKNNISKVSLFENGEDISEHKVPDTYKKISSILKLDFEIFSQLSYQSSVDLLQFLKATDTNRKKFLVNLFNLEKYLNYGDIIKVKLSESEKKYTMSLGELNSIDTFLSETIIAEKKDFKELVELNQKLYNEKDKLVNESLGYEKLCKDIDKNNLYIKERNELKFHIDLREPREFIYQEEYDKLTKDLISISLDFRNNTNSLKSLDLSDKCPTCNQSIDNTKAVEMQKQIELELYKNKTRKKDMDERISNLNIDKEKCNREQKIYDNNNKTIEKFEQLSQLIDNDIPKEYPNIVHIEDKLSNIKEKIRKTEKENKDITEYNNKIIEHNTKVDTLIQQKREFLARKYLLEDDIDDIKNVIKCLNILKKAFSPTGLVAFKLENLTKNLEETINYYLAELSDGMFQVMFRLSGEKLNIVVIQNGKESPIETVSGGEFSRIQLSILLAIRSVLSEIGGNSVNILFLDEISGTLDELGKEKLIDVLREEKDLNVFLVSHDFSHPLVEKLHIVKENNISRIDN